MNAIAIHPFRAWTIAAFLASIMTASVLAQGNDNFADRITLPSILPASTNGNNFRATAELNEPSHAQNVFGSPEASVWWSWTAPSSGVVQIDTIGSDFAEVLMVYTGATLSTLTEITSNGAPGGLSQYHIRFFVRSGTTYQIAVDGHIGSFFADGEGNVVLNISQVMFPTTTAVQLIAPDHLLISWESTPGETYDVIPSTNLTMGAWFSPLATVLATNTTSQADIFFDGLGPLFLHVSVGRPIVVHLPRPTPPPPLLPINLIP